MLPLLPKVVSSPSLVSQLLLYQAVQQLIQILQVELWSPRASGNPPLSSFPGSPQSRREKGPNHLRVMGAIYLIFENMQYNKNVDK